MKVERVSYDLITPSAARALFECIFWKPAIRWQIDKIEVLKPIKWISIRRNEVSDVVPVLKVKQAMKSGRGEGDLALNIEDKRQQRAGLLLRDVAYRVYGHLEFVTDEGKANQRKYHEMFERRADKGQCVNQPYLGCREFAARFRRVTAAAQEPPPIDETRDLGWMLYDLDYRDRASPQPQFFRAQLCKGVVDLTTVEVAQ